MWRWFRLCSGAWPGWSGAVLDARGLDAGLDDLAIVSEAVEERGGHLCVAEDSGPFAEGEVGGDDDRGALVEAAEQVEQQLAAGLGEGQIATRFNSIRCPKADGKMKPEGGQNWLTITLPSRSILHAEIQAGLAPHLTNLA